MTCHMFANITLAIKPLVPCIECLSMVQTGVADISLPCGVGSTLRGRVGLGDQSVASFAKRMS